MWKAHFNLRRRTERSLEEVDHASNELPQIDGLYDEILASRESEHALRQRRAALGAQYGVVDQSQHLRIVGQAPLQQLKAPEYGHQEIVEIVRDAARELTDRVELLRME